MGSMFEKNDTLQLTKGQGFPEELDLEKHLGHPYRAENFIGKIFEFKDKPKVRIYNIPPVRNFLVENKNGKWIYWGLIRVLEIRNDYVSQTTSGKFEIIYIYTPEEMKAAHDMIDRNEETRFFK